MRRFVPLATVLLCLAFLARASAQQPAAAPDSAAKKRPWYVDSAHGPPLPFTATLDEGTWMSVDISPDGRTLVFDLLGDIWSLPIAGGQATRLTHGPAFDMQPRFAPDGRRIVFVSDRGGNNNVWLMDADGGKPRVLHEDKAANYSSPTFMPDGQYVVAQRTQIMTPARDQSGVFLYHVNGGSGVKLFGPNGAGMAPSRDGRWIYYTVAGQSGFRIDRFDRTTGVSLPSTSGYGGAARPALSPDGRWLAFGRRVDAEERLAVRDLRTGAERVLDVRLDRQGMNGDGDVLPGLAFAPDGRSIVYSAMGKIRRVELASGVSAVIPFTANFEQALTDKVSFTVPVRDGPVNVRLMRWMQRTPDGRRIVFSAAGKNYVYEVGTRRVTPFHDGPGLQYGPAISPDGRWVAYVSWSDAEGGGHVYKAPIEGGAPVQLTTDVARYENPAWSPDGSRLVVLQGSGAELRGGANIAEDLYYEVRWLDARAPGEAHLVTALRPFALRRSRVRPRFDHTGERIYFSESPVPDALIPDYTELVSVRLDGSDKRRHARFTFADDIAPSPDGQWVAFIEQFELYLAPIPAVGAEPVRIAPTGGTLPATKLSREGAYYVEWADSGRAVTWGWGDTFYERAVGGARPAPGDSVRPTATRIALMLPRAQASGQLLLRNARIITMGQAGVIDRGDILVENGRIKAIGPNGRVSPPAGVRTIDVSGKTIMPGMVDIHAHHLEGEVTETFPERDWGYVAQLAYGVTTIRDPSARSQAIFTQAEMVETGRAMGPRIFSTGDILWFQPSPFAIPVNDLEDARMQVRRLKRLGATYIKQYMQPRREQRQWVVEASRAESLMVTPEGGSATFFDLTTVMDGHTGLEHAIPTAPLYKDVLSLLARQKTYYTPTLIIAYGGPNAEQWFYQHENPHDDAKLRRFTPHMVLDERTRERPMFPEDEYHFLTVARTATDLLRLGGNPALGAHGQRQGLGAHWELWAFAKGGMTPMEALRVATVIPAQALGMQSDLGSLEAGKLADLVVLDANPLDDIRNTVKIRYVMKGGTMWEGETMDEVWPRAERFKGFWWKRYEKGSPRPE